MAPFPSVCLPVAGLTACSSLFDLLQGLVTLSHSGVAQSNRNSSGDLPAGSMGFASSTQRFEGDCPLPLFQAILSKI